MNLRERKLLPDEKLPMSFYSQKTERVASALLGKRLVRIWRGKRLSGVIVETEAYLGANDAACHTWKNRRTDRVNSMFLAGGHAYVYMIYGMHYCFNVVSRGLNEPEAVLIRAIEPDDLSLWRTDGPGRLCKALRISRAHDGFRLDGETIFIEQSGRFPAKEEIGRSPRVGVEYAGEAAHWPLRFFWRGNPHLSRKESKWKTGSQPIEPSGLIT